MSKSSVTQRTFLFLQGPHGAFFPKLGEKLVSCGHRVCRINFNGGDYATWPDGDGFRLPVSRFPTYIADYLRRHSVTDLLLYGDARPKHTAAIEAAQAQGVRVHVFEEGYLRPDWITLERDGVNGRSGLPRDPDWYRDQARGLLPVPVHEPLLNYRSVRGWAALFYYAEYVLQFWRFPLHRSHRTFDPVGEGLSHVFRFIGCLFGKPPRHDVRMDKGLAEGDFVLFPLQLDSDYQIRVYSPFANLSAAMTHVLDDFAANAPADLRLVVKEHPLDSGLIDWGELLVQESELRGIANRVAFTRSADLEPLIDAARGLVTVNSTSGTLAMTKGVPVKVLGTAVYDIRGICDQQPLAGFWSDPAAPDADLFDAFQRVLVDRCLYHGAFLSLTGTDLLVEKISERLTRVESDSAMVTR